MKIIFAKHKDDPKEYIFEVPENMHPEKGDVLFVRTVRGNAVAVATSNPIQLKDYVEIVEKFGAYLPLQKVRTYANKEMIAYIEYEFLKKAEKTILPEGMLNILRYEWEAQKNE